MHFKITFILGFLFLFLDITACAQKENNNWYFGEQAGITFNKGRPVVLPPNAINTKEGTISVSDPEGNLLFYSDGERIWNRNHRLMQNGSGLMGHSSATQAVLAVKKPDSPSIYYIFTVDAFENNVKNGLRYSILDMSLDGGFGGITNTKNVLLEVPVTEKLTAVRHGNNKNYWVIAHKWNSDEFVAYELTSSGIIHSPVISKTGAVHGGSSFLNVTGQMKANRAGTKLALTKQSPGRFELYDLDAETGKVSNARFSDSIFYETYGVEFSGDGTKLYGTAERPNGLIQFNLETSEGLSSFISIPISDSRLGGLQIGPDSKIYCAAYLYSSLGVINKPNALGLASEFMMSGVDLKGKRSGFSLPSPILTAKKDFEYWETIQPFIPNIITPNNDKLNDKFVLQGLNPASFELQIFNRWGSLIYKAESYADDWDAKGNSAGMYYYLLRNSETGQTFKGWLEVVK